MSYGLEIQNLNGKLILSDQYPSYYIRETGILTTVTEAIIHPTTGASGSQIQLGATDLLFVKPDLSINYSMITPAFTNFTIAAGMVGVAADPRYLNGPFSTEHITTVPYLVLRKFSNAVVSADTYGMSIFRADGTVAFDSRMPYATIHHSVAISEAEIAETISISSKQITKPIPNAAAPLWICLNGTAPYYYDEAAYTGGGFVESLRALQIGLVYTGASGYSYSLHARDKSYFYKYYSSGEAIHSFSYPHYQNYPIIAL